MLGYDQTDHSSRSVGTAEVVRRNPKRTRAIVRQGNVQSSAYSAVK